MHFENINTYWSPSRPSPRVTRDHRHTRPPSHETTVTLDHRHTRPPSHETTITRDHQPVPSQFNPPPAKKKKVVAYLLITGQTFQAHQQILDHLNKGPLSISVTEDVQQCDVILLFCPILSRVRSDVESAFRKIPDGAEDKPVVLVLLHHTRKPDQVLKQTQWMDEFPMVIQEAK
uniref:Uncharacterized protein n=1 Tax=Knipowitschia caucasica TaxID=637954 RepID=A0AAV2J8R1_KNICA